jgi:hypothetical protein
MKYGWALNSKVIEDILIFPAVIDPSSYGQRFESYDICKLGVLLKFQLWTEQDIWINLEFEPTFNGKLEEP